MSSGNQLQFEETKEADGLRIMCKWTYDPKVERRVTLIMKEFKDGKVNITLFIENTAIKYHATSRVSVQSET